MWLFYLILIIIFIPILSWGLAGFSLAPWVPCWKKDLKRIFKLAGLKDGETFYDLGCGNGRVIFYAAKHYNIRAVGVELAIPFYLICQARQLFYKDKDIKFKLKNLFKEDLSRADVVYFFGLPGSIKKKLKQKLERELKPGARVVSYSFSVPGWQPVVVDKPSDRELPVYLYLVEK